MINDVNKASGFEIKAKSKATDHRKRQHLLLNQLM